MENKKASLGFKISLSLISLLGSLILLEVGFRITGKFVYETQNRRFIPYQEPAGYERDSVYEYFESDKEKGVIVTIGDSFTNGGNVQSFHTYPYYLFKHFERDENPKEVLNMGLCEDSSIRIVARLEKLFKQVKLGKKVRPEKIIMLVGSADKFERYEGEVDDNLDTVSFQIKAPPALRSLRIYKAYRHIRLSLLAKELSGEEQNKKVNFEEINVAYKRLRNSLNTQLTKPEGLGLATLKQLPDSFKDYSQRLSLKLNTPLQILHSLSVYQSKLLASQKRHDEGVFWLLDTAKNFPIPFFKGEMETAFYRLVQMFQIQSKYEGNDVAQILNEIKGRNPEVESLDHFKKLMTMVTSWEEVDKDIEKERLESWEKIVGITKENKVQLILMNYPSDYESANAMLKTVSEKYGLPLIDNHSYFSPLIQKHGREKILEDDDHLTAWGYELMADHIYEKIKSL